MEVETQLTIAAVLCYLSRDQEAALLNQTSQLGKIINGLIASVAK
jgi:four helix bundle protein